MMMMMALPPCHAVDPTSRADVDHDFFDAFLDGLDALDSGNSLQDSSLTCDHSQQKMSAEWQDELKRLTDEINDLESDGLKYSIDDLIQAVASDDDDVFTFDTDVYSIKTQSNVKESDDSPHSSPTACLHNPVMPPLLSRILCSSLGASSFDGVVSRPSKQPPTIVDLTFDSD